MLFHAITVILIIRIIIFVKHTDENLAVLSYGQNHQNLQSSHNMLSIFTISKGGIVLVVFVCLCVCVCVCLSVDETALEPFEIIVKFLRELGTFKGSKMAAIPMLCDAPVVIYNVSDVVAGA